MYVEDFGRFVFGDILFRYIDREMLSLINVKNFENNCDCCEV